MAVTSAVAQEELAQARHRLALDGVAIAVSAAAFAVVYGFTARAAGFSLIETSAMSVIVFAGGAQFAAIGLIVQGVPWLAIVLLTGLLNARHLLYSAALAPWLVGRSVAERATTAYPLTDEAFALSLPFFRRIGRFDRQGYWIAAMLVTWIPWNISTILGYVGGQFLPDPHQLGLDVVFPAAMAGLATALVTGRRELVAAISGVVIGVGVALAGQTSLGIVAGGLLGPLVGMLVPRAPGQPDGDGDAGDERTDELLADPRTHSGTSVP